MKTIPEQLEERLAQLRAGREQLLAQLQATSGAVAEVERTLELIRTYDHPPIAAETLSDKGLIVEEDPA